MDQTIEQRLAAAKQIAASASTKRIQLETKLEAAQLRKKEILEKCEQLGIKPEDLQKRISELDASIQEGLVDLDLLLPQDKSADDLPYGSI